MTTKRANEASLDVIHVMQMTYRIAHALGWDAADRQMTKEGRTRWNEADALLAAITLREHFPVCQELPGIAAD